MRLLKRRFAASCMLRPAVDLLPFLQLFRIATFEIINNLLVRRSPKYVFERKSNLLQAPVFRFYSQHV